MVNPKRKAPEKDNNTFSEPSFLRLMNKNIPPVTKVMKNSAI